MALTEPQWIALVSFVFNEGETKFLTSTLLRLLNTGDYSSVPVQLLRWTKETIDGRLVENVGLRNRRSADVPPVLSSTAIWSPIPQPKEIGREEAVYRRTDHRLPA